MKIIIQETSAEQTLTIIHPVTRLNWVHDFIGATPALSNGEFNWDESRKAYICSQATYDWWIPIINSHHDMHCLIHALIAKHGYNLIKETLTEARKLAAEFKKTTLARLKSLEHSEPQRENN